MTEHMNTPMLLMEESWTSFDYSEPTGGWTGLDLGRKIRIDRIVYTPRNRVTLSGPGDDYELFYCDRDWKSGGKIKSASDSLVFRNIPGKMRFCFCATIHAEWTREFLFTKKGINDGNKNIS